MGKRGKGAGRRPSKDAAPTPLTPEQEQQQRALFMALVEDCKNLIHAVWAPDLQTPNPKLQRDLGKQVELAVGEQLNLANTMGAWLTSQSGNHVLVEVTKISEVNPDHKTWEVVATFQFPIKVREAAIAEQLDWICCFALTQNAALRALLGGLGYRLRFTIMDPPEKRLPIFKQ